MAAWVYQLTATTVGEDILAGHGVRGGKVMVVTLRRTADRRPGPGDPPRPRCCGYRLATICFLSLTRLRQLPALA